MRMSKAHPGIAKNRCSVERGDPQGIHRFLNLLLIWIGAGLLLPQLQAAGPVFLEGVQVVPHVQSTNVLYLKPPSLRLGARVQLFLRNSGNTCFLG